MTRADVRRLHLAVVSPPAPGHIDPLIALAAALAAQGHRCTLVHVADSARLVSGSLGFAPLPAPAGTLDSYLARLGDPTGPVGLARMIRATAAMTARLLDQAPAAIADIGADAVLADSAEPAGALLAARLGLPCVATVTGLPLLAEPGVPPPFVGWRYRSDAVGRFRNGGGYLVSRALLRPIDTLVRERARAWGVEGRPLLQVAQCPAALDFPRAALPPSFRYGAPWRLPDDAEAELPDDGRPLVFCSLGTLQGGRAALFAAMAGACVDVGARAVVAHGGGLSPAAVAALPGRPLVRATWPQRAVLRRCAAAMLHGGFNTVLDALTAGVPIVAVPIAFEQPATAARVARTGAGRVVPFRQADRRALAEALRAVLGEPGYRRSAEALRTTLTGRDGAAEAAAAISAALCGGSAAGTTASPG